MRHRQWTRLVAAVVGGVGLALAAPMLAAVGQVSPPASVLSIGPTARLVAQGAAVAVPVFVQVTCPAGSTANVSVQVAQAVGRDVAHAFGDASVDCDGTPQVVEVFAVSQDFRFFQGPAFVQARLFCGGFPPFPSTPCTAQAQREVQIVGDFGPPPFPPPPPTFLPPPPTFLPPPPTFVPPPPTSVPGVPGIPDISALIAQLLALLGSFGAVV